MRSKEMQRKDEAEDGEISDDSGDVRYGYF